jgi:peptidoglycan/LPS O-acetylase OafA/YrhL
MKQDPSVAGETQSGALTSIQILRALAALMVAAYHAQLELATRLGLPDSLPSFSFGAAGVDLFFVISGFIMVYASERLFGRPEASRVFFLRRLARIVPLYWAASGVLLAYILIAGIDFAVSNVSLGTIVASFLFLPYPRPDGLMMPLHGLGWTLNYEMFFYVVFAVGIVLPRRNAVLAIAAFLTAIVAVNWMFGPFPEPLAFWCGSIMLEFCFGMLIALAYRHGLRLPTSVTYGLILAALVGYATTKFSAANVTFRLIEWGLPAAALVAALVLSKDAAKPGAVGRAFAFLGDASYSLYLLHPLTIDAARRFLPRLIDPAAFPWVYALALIALAVAVAVVAYLVFEKPVTRALQGRIRGVPARPAAGADQVSSPAGSWPSRPA